MECAALFTVFLVLLIAFERLRVAISMLWVALLAMCAVFAGLWITHTALNISSMMGMTMVIGIVTEVGVFYVMETARPAHVALDRALIDAGVARVRPIRVSNDHAFMCSRDVSAARARGRWGIRTGTYGPFNVRIARLRARFATGYRASVHVI